MDSTPKMDLGNEFVVHESVEDDEEIRNGSVSENLKNIAESNSSYKNNGSVVVENGDDDGLLPDWKQKGSEVLASVNSSPEQSSSVASVKKGVGLRKWRRIRRDPNRVGDNCNEADKIAMPDMESGQNRIKRMLFNGEQRNQRREGSVSSTNAVIGMLGSFTPLDDSEFGLGFAPGTDAESSEHQSSRSSTAASAPKKKHDTGGAADGFPRDKNRMRSLSGKNLMSTIPRGQQGKVRAERGKAEKETSRSSIESDSRSSNFVCVKSTSNGIRNGVPKNSEGQNSDEAEGSQQEVSYGHGGDNGRDDGGEYDDLSPEDAVGVSRYHDILVESIFDLQSAQDALEKEVLKFKDIGKDISVDGSVSDIDTELLLQSNVIEVETELDNLFKQKMEAELEYLVISRSVENLKLKIAVLEEQRAIASEQANLLDRLENTENKVAMLRDEAKKLQLVCEDITRTGEILRFQNAVWKYSFCSALQLVLMIAIITFFIQHTSPDYGASVPT